jgi:hypothetical protein
MELKVGGGGGREGRGQGERGRGQGADILSARNLSVSCARAPGGPPL